MNFLRRLPALFRRSKLDREMDDELRFHIEEQTRANLAAGMSPDDAALAARKQFGWRERIREEAREALGWRWLEDAFRDLRHAARMLRKAPGFTASAALTLAVGIAASTILFSAVKGILLRPLPFADADQLVWIFSDNLEQGVVGERSSAAEFRILREQGSSFTALASINGWSLALEDSGTPVFLRGLRVRPELFDVLDVRPALGRRLNVDDLEGGDDGVMLISHELWQGRFGGAHDVIGTTLHIDSNHRRTIVGVLPAGLQFPLVRSPQAGNGTELAAGSQDFWIPARRTSADFGRYETLIGRLHPDATTTQVAAELHRIGDALAAESPASNSGWSFRMTSMREQIVGRTGPALKVLLVAVALVLLVVCANVANLLLCRGLARHSEFAVRLALGASRSRLFRQMLAESLLLSGVAAALGLALAALGLPVLVALGPAGVPFLHELTLDGSMLASALLLALGSGLLAGIAPAWRLSESAPQHALKSRAAGGTETAGTVRWRNGMVVAQIAATVVLLSASALLLRSFVRLTGTDLGYDAQPVLTAELFLGGDETKGDLREHLFAHLRDVSWVKAAGAVHSLPLTGTWTIRDTFAIGSEVGSTEGGRQASMSFIGFDYFKAMGVPLVRGRTFDSAESLDMENAPVAIVNESFARRFFPGEDALGKTIVAPARRERRIVGIVGDTRDARVDLAGEAQFYLPLVLGDMKLVVQTAGAPASFTEALRREIAALDPRIRMTNITPMDRIVAGTLEERRFALLLMICFGAVSLLLGSIGIYGVLSCTVALRKKEIGIRMALGGRATDIVHMVLRHGWKLTWRGSVVGLVLAFALSRFLESQLFGVRATDALSYAATVCALGCATLLACWLPARRATRVDPLIALRAE